MSPKVDPEITQAIEFLHDKSILIIEESSTLRTALKQFFIKFECQNSQIEYAEAYSLGEKQLNSIRPQIVLCSYQFESSEKDGFDLHKIHNDIFPNRSDAIFILVSSKNNLTVTTQVTDQEVDGLILKPLTGDTLKTTFLAALKHKYENPTYYQSIQRAKSSIHERSFDAALLHLTESLKHTKSPVMTHYYRGIAYKSNSDSEKAIEAFKDGLSIDPFHYRCLTGIFDTFADKDKFQEMALYGQTLYEKYPFNPCRIPQLIRSLVYVKNYQVIIAFARTIRDEENISNEHIPHLAAGLTIAGKLLIEELKIPDATDVLEVAAQMSIGHLKIFAKIIHILLEAKMIKVAHKFFNLIDSDKSKESAVYKLLEYEMMAYSSKHKPLELVKIGTDLIDKNIKSPILYHHLIEKSIEAKRKKDIIEDLIYQCKKEFPDFKLKDYKF